MTGKELTPEDIQIHTQVFCVIILNCLINLGYISFYLQTIILSYCCLTLTLLLLSILFQYQCLIRKLECLAMYPRQSSFL